MRRQLTEAMIEKLNPPATGRLEIFDAIQTALALRVTPNGAKTFVVRGRIRGQRNPLRVAIGDALAMKLSDARIQAGTIRAAMREGKDPRELRHAAEVEAQRTNAVEMASDEARRFEIVAEDFIAAHVSRLRTATHTAAEIRRYLVARWQGRDIATIDADDIGELIREIADAGKPHMARLILAHAKRLFRWAAAPGRPRAMRLHDNPCINLSAKKDFDIATAPRQVVLSNDHLRLLWKAAGELGAPYGHFFKLALLSGQRRGEVAEMQWAELDLDRDMVWVIPAERMKAKKPHEVPLSHPMIKILSELRESRGKGDYVLSSSLGQHAIANFNRAKLQLDKGVAELRLEEGHTNGSDAAVVGLPEWRIHDLRRTVRTGLGAIPGVPHDIRELVIAHIPDTLVATYDLHGYREEKRQALEAWAKRLLSIVEPGKTHAAPSRPKPTKDKQRAKR